MTTKVAGRFAVDAEGFRNQMKSREPFRLVQELVSNSFDEPTANSINVNISFSQRKKKIVVEAVDDGAGFARIQDAYTLFGYSSRIENPEQRGRYQMGEKQFFAVCDYGRIRTTGKEIVFDGDTRKESDLPSTTKGTDIYGELPFGESHVEGIVKKLKKIIVPVGKTLVVNGVEVSQRSPLRQFEARLETVNASTRGSSFLTSSIRKTTVSLYEVEDGSRAWLYEMGIPVQSIFCEWHVDVHQKIPQNPNREAVSDAWLKKLFVEVVNHAYDLVSNDKAGENFVRLGMSGATAEAAKSLLTKVYGTDQVFFKGIDYRANEKAMEVGELVPDGVFDYETRFHLAEIGVANYASKVFKTNLGDAEIVPADTDELISFAATVKAIARETIGHDIDVNFIRAEKSVTVAAQYLSRTMTINLTRMPDVVRGKFTPEVLGVVIHELAHDKDHDSALAHLTMAYVDELQRIAGIVGMEGLDYFVSQGEMA